MLATRVSTPLRQINPFVMARPAMAPRMNSRVMGWTASETQPIATGFDRPIMAPPVTSAAQTPSSTGSHLRGASMNRVNMM
jgi:hypothetical protein